MSKRVILFVILASIFGTQAFAADAPAGQSVLKLNAIAEENPVREARKELVAVEKEIKSLDQDIQITHAEIIMMRGNLGFSRVVPEQLEARENVMRMKRDDLKVKKTELEATLTSSGNNLSSSNN